MNSTKVLSLLLENTREQFQASDINQVPNLNQVAQITAIDDEPIRGLEDPIKSFIDKLIDTKNKVLRVRSQEEINNVVNSNQN